MVKSVLYNLRYLLGNWLGVLLYLFFGKRKLLRGISEDNILSIYFHNPSVKVFEDVIKWLVKNKFNVLTPHEFRKFYNNKRCEAKRNVFISFDDAWLGNLDLIPVLEKYNIPVTLFVSTKAVEDGQIWLNIVRKQFANLDEKVKKGITVKDLKKISYAHGLALYSNAVKINDVRREIMTKQELIEFTKHVSVGSHTVTHPILTNCDPDDVTFELNESMKLLSNWGINLNGFFAYPNGSYGPEVIKGLEKSEYKYAFTTESQFVDLIKSKNNYAIPRICIPDGLGKYENLVRMSTVWTKIFKN